MTKTKENNFLQIACWNTLKKTFFASEGGISKLDRVSTCPDSLKTISLSYNEIKQIGSQFDNCQGLEILR